MKKILSMILVLCMVFALCACGDKNEGNGKRTPPDVTEKIELIDKETGESEEFTMEGYWVVTDVIVDGVSVFDTTTKAEEKEKSAKNAADDADDESLEEAAEDIKEAIAEAEAGEADADAKGEEADAKLTDTMEDIKNSVDKITGEEADEADAEAEAEEDESVGEFAEGLDIEYIEVLKHMYLYLNADGTGRLSIAGLENDLADAITWGDGIIRSADESEIKYEMDGNVLVIVDEEENITMRFEHADAAPEALNILGLVGDMEIPNDLDLSGLNGEAEEGEAEG